MSSKKPSQSKLNSSSWNGHSFCFYSVCACSLCNFCCILLLYYDWKLQKFFSDYCSLKQTNLHNWRHWWASSFRLSRNVYIYRQESSEYHLLSVPTVLPFYHEILSSIENQHLPMKNQATHCHFVNWSEMDFFTFVFLFVVFPTLMIYLALKMVEKRKSRSLRSTGEVYKYWIVTHIWMWILKDSEVSTTSFVVHVKFEVDSSCIFRCWVQHHFQLSWLKVLKDDIGLIHNADISIFFNGFLIDVFLLVFKWSDLCVVFFDFTISRFSMSEQFTAARFNFRWWIMRQIPE